MANLKTIASTAAQVLAFCYVSTSWGTSDIIMPYRTTTLPAFYNCAANFGLSGLLLLLFSYTRNKGENKSPLNFRQIMIASASLVMLPAIAVLLTKIHVRHNLSALLFTSVPVVIIALTWWRRGTAPRLLTAVGLVAGFYGCWLSLFVDDWEAVRKIDFVGIFILGAGAFSAAWGAIYTKELLDGRLVRLFAGLQLILAALVLAILGTISGEFMQTNFATIGKALSGNISSDSIDTAFAFSLYLWLLKKMSPLGATSVAFPYVVMLTVLSLLSANELVFGRQLISFALIGLTIFALCREKNNGTGLLSLVSVPAATVSADAEPVVDREP